MLPVLAAIVSSSAWASAADVPVALTWRTPPDAECPTSADVLDQIERLVGRAEGRVPVEATADVERDETGQWNVRLTTKVGDVTGQRIISGRSCKAMADATVIVLAWMIDPDRMASRGEDTTASPARPVPHVPPKPKPRAPAPNPPPRGSTGVFGQVGLEALGDAGTLPFVTLGIGARGSVGVDAFFVSPFVGVWPSRSVVVASAANGSPIGADLWFGSVGIDACVSPMRPWFAGCLGSELDRLAGRGFGIVYPQSGSSIWWALRASAGIQVPLSRILALTADPALIVPTRRTRFGIHGIGDVDRSHAIVLRVGVGLALELGSL